VNDGSARTNKPFDGKKKLLDAFHWLSSEHRNFLYLNLDKRFSQSFLQAAKYLVSSDMSNAMKYRHLKEFSKNGLIVKCSPIQGRGLFTLVDLQPSQMIIEYAGEIIRHQLCDKREKNYETKVSISF
jgi:SET domain-containing protein